MGKSRETKSHNNKDRINELREQYKMNLEFLRFEAKVMWQIFNAFFIGNNIFFVLIIAIFTEMNGQINYWLLMFAGIIGFIISLLWFQSFKRNESWYRFRMNQAKNAEEKYIKIINDAEWFLLNKDAEKYPKDKSIKVNDKSISGLRNNKAAYAMIIVFKVIYIVIAVYSLFNLCCN